MLYTRQSMLPHLVQREGSCLPAVVVISVHVQYLLASGGHKPTHDALRQS
jgi:hypothetical protein